MFRKLIFIFLLLKSAFLFGQMPLPEKLGKAINTNAHEYWPCIMVNDKMLIFNRLIDEGGRKNEDFYYSLRDSLGNWQTAEPLAALNTSKNEGAPTVSADGRFMIFTSCNNRDSFGSCDLYYSLKIGNQWLPARNLGSTINTRYWETQPSLSADGTELYFVSNRPTGKGNMDIWHSRLLRIDEQGEMHWSKPKNLSINTPESDMSPFIHSDNETLYFSSNGYTKNIENPQLDIFITRKKGGKFSRPKNIGKPINTPADELGFVVNATGTRAYFCSDKDTRNRDIYTYPIPVAFRPKKVQVLQGKVRSSKEKTPLLATISLYDVNDSTAVYNALTDFDSGDYVLCLIQGKQWQLSVQAEGHFFHSERVDLRTQELKKQQKDIVLTAIEKGKKITLKNIFFDTDKATLKEVSKIELKNVKQLLLQHPTLRIELSGHTDNQGSEEYNQKLSEARAAAVFEWLVNEGIAKKRLVAKGYGKLQPVATNATAQGRAKNRRTELKVIDY